MKQVSADHVKFGKRVRALRSDHMTQEILAAKVGVDRSYIGFLERGEANPSLTMIIKIAKVLGVQPYQLLKD
jgi:transcriptional regulator with XRE-family HTH domain